MTAERGSKSRETGLPASGQYWVLLTDVTCADINRVLEIYGQVTKRAVPTVEEEEFKRLKHDFETGNGIVPLAITKQTHLEWRRSVRTSEIYVRFKFGGGSMHYVFRDPKVEETIQKQIDAHFKGRSISLSKLPKIDFPALK